MKNKEKIEKIFHQYKNIKFDSHDMGMSEKNGINRLKTYISSIDKNIEFSEFVLRVLDIFNNHPKIINLNNYRQTYEVLFRE